MTGQGYVIGLALLDARGDALIGVMGVPTEAECPPIMAAVRGHGLRYWNAVGDSSVEYDSSEPGWDLGDADDGLEVRCSMTLTSDMAVPHPLGYHSLFPHPRSPPRPYAHVQAPPWLISPQKMSTECIPFGEAGAGLRTICCGAMIKYFQCAAGRVAGFVQYEENLKTWDHAYATLLEPRHRTHRHQSLPGSWPRPCLVRVCPCTWMPTSLHVPVSPCPCACALRCGLICVSESGGDATDAFGDEVIFPDRTFAVKGGVVCTSKWATPTVRQKLLNAAKRT